MATMVKEKKPKFQKKKPKIKSTEAKEVEDFKLRITEEPESNLVDLNVNNTNLIDLKSEQQLSDHAGYKELGTKDVIHVNSQLSKLEQSQQIKKEATGSEVLPLQEPSLQDPKLQTHNNYSEIQISKELSQLKLESHSESENGVRFKDLNTQLDHIRNEDELPKEECTPSAPIYYELSQTFEASIPTEIACNVKTKVPCLAMEEAIRLFAGHEMYVVKEMSDQEEGLVEVGGYLEPQHPLVDLITHLRSSLVAVERERQRISQGYREEQSTISQLWIVEKRKKNISEKCKCGGEISFLVTYDYAELQKKKLAAAKLGLESLLRDVLDSYCSHQHEAMLTYCEIEDEIGLILQRGREEIRDCLAFILQSLKCSDEFGDVYVKVLQEWAFTLASALFNKEPDMRDLLFLVHLLFRQSRSVRWAERVVRMRVDDFNTAARFIAFLDILLSQPVPESALECREDVHEESSEAWEELDASGSSGGVGKGKLREGDLLALLNAFPIRELIASLVLLSEPEPRQESCWRGATAGGVLKGACGVRVLLSVIAGALPRYRAYAAVHALLCRVACATLTALAALHLQSRSNYQSDIKERISTELEACFVLGFSMLDKDKHLLPTTLLSDDTASDFCITLMSSLHVSASRRIETLGIEAPAVLSCAERVRMVAFAAAQQRNSALAKAVIEFLLQTGTKQKSETCKDKCETAARELIPHLLAAHTHLHTAAFYMLADISNVESIDPLSVKSLSPEKWHPSPTDVQGVLNYWYLKCPVLIKQLLHQIDCTPHIGMSLESQLVVGSWLCEYARGRAEAEWAWSALRRLRTHRVLWGLPLDAPAPQHTDSLMDAAFALLSSEWGHLVPLVCSVGVSALRRLAGARVEDAVHCLECVLRVLALSPESISHTPEFTEIFKIILNSGPSLVQRALGRGGRSGQQMLQQLVLDQLHEHRSNERHRAAILSAWLHALWCPALPPASRAILDVALRTARDWRTLNEHVMYALEEGKNELVNDAVTHASVAPLLANSALRGALELEVREGVATRLLPTLDRQRRVGEKIHVDNALRFIGCKLYSDELVIHRAAAAVLLAPLEGPAHLLLWSLFFHLYLQRPHNTASVGTPPAGPWFFSGIVMSRTLNKLKKRLQDTVYYHRNAIKELRTQEATPKEETRSDKGDNLSKADDCILPPLTLKDLRGDTDLESEISIDHQSDNVESDTKVKSDTPNLISYHTAAERMVVIFEQWLNKGEELRAQPHHAEISRHLTKEDLHTGWSASLRDVAGPSDTHSPAPGPAPAPALTYYEQIINAINEFHNRTNRRKPVRRSSSLPDINYNDQTSVIDVVKKYLAAVDKLVASWSSEVSRVRTLDQQLWPVLGRLRTRCSLPNVKIPCSKACRPVLVKIQEHEWRLSSEAEREIKENRRSAANALRRLAQPKTHAARVTAALIAISRRINDKNIALRVLKIMYCSVDDEKAPAHRSLISFIKFLAERWVCSDGEACAGLLHLWSRAGAHALCGALVRPERPHARQWRALYVTLLHAPLQPVAVFSYLSRFDMAYWATVVSEDERRDVLASLLEAVAQYGQYKGEEYQMLIELLGVHSGKVCLAGDTLSHVSSCVRAATATALPAAYLAHLTPLVNAHRQHLHHDQLEQLLTEVGDKWRIRGVKKTEAYAPHVASLLRALLRIYVVALTEQTYIPENVGVRAWSAARTSWAPWVTPWLKLLADLHHYTAMLDAFVDTLVQLMDDCPGSDVFVLRHAWEWVVECYTRSHEAHAPRAAVLLAKMRRLPWDRQWRVSAALHTAHRVACLNLPELSAWVGHTWSALSAATWVAGVKYEHLGQVLPVLFQIFTSKFMQLSEQTLEEACRLPWSALSPQITEQLLDAYFTAYHNPARPYHDLLHFKLVLRLSELGASCGVDEAAQSKRCSSVTAWAKRTVAAPALRAHVPALARRLLHEIHDTAPRIENYGNYLEELVCRAIVMLSMEQDAYNGLPVWQKWVCSCTARERRAVVVACGTLGASHTFAPLVDTLAQQILDTDSGGWSVVWRPLAGRPGAGAALRQQHYYAAYALLRAAPLAVDDARSAFTALAAATVNFMVNEVIISLWVCALCRVAREFAIIVDGHAAERAAATRDVCALLAKWAGLKRSLIQMVTLQHATVPTQRHRLLCFLGLCILSNLPSTGIQSPHKEYENACQSSASLGVNVSDIIKWGQSPKPSYLPRLAVMLFPDRKVYFEEELSLAPTDL